LQYTFMVFLLGFVIGSFGTEMYGSGRRP